MSAEAQHVEHGRVDLSEGSSGAPLDDRVVETTHAGHAVDELRGKRRVTATQVRLTQTLGQFEVGVRTIGDSPQRLERDGAGLVALLRALSGAVDRSPARIRVSSPATEPHATSAVLGTLVCVTSVVATVVIAVATSIVAPAVAVIASIATTVVTPVVVTALGSVG